MPLQGRRIYQSPIFQKIKLSVISVPTFDIYEDSQRTPFSFGF